MYRTGLGIPLLHLLFYAVIVTQFVCALISSTANDNIKDSNKDKKEYDYQQNKHFSENENENETYHSDKRLIIEEYYRQSAISVTNFRDNFNVNLHKNHSSKYNINENTVMDNDSIVVVDDIVLNENDTSLTSNYKHSDLLNKLEMLSSNRGAGGLSLKLPDSSINSNKNEKWKLDSSFKKLNGTTNVPTLTSINNRNYSTIIKPTLSHTLTAAAKLHKTDAPMLNLVFDSYAPNKHRHYDFRLGTHFDGIAVGSLINNFTIQEGKTAYLNCKINSIQDKTVSWVRRFYDASTVETSELQLLTVGMHTYTGDLRYSVDFESPNNWRLKIQSVVKRDEGFYECQLSTHPPKVIQFYLQVNAPELLIVDESHMPLYERHYEVNSTLELYCLVHNIEMTSSVVLWTHNEHVLNYDAIRGGISVKTDLTEEGANSTLYVAKINKSDSGNYTCSVGPNAFTTTVHVLNGK
ncbi:unnamed protein product [Diamesa serratosioi]